MSVKPGGRSDCCSLVRAIIVKLLSPAFVFHDDADDDVTNTVFLTQGAIPTLPGLMLGSDGPNQRPCEFRSAIQFATANAFWFCARAVAFTPRAPVWSRIHTVLGTVRAALNMNVRAVLVADCPPPFCYGIGNVVSMRTKKQMIRANAGRIVTAVEDQKSLWDWTYRKLVCLTVRSYGKFWGERESSVAMRGTGGGPEPAVAGLVNLRPESNLDWLRARRHGVNLLDCTLSPILPHAGMK